MNCPHCGRPADCMLSNCRYCGTKVKPTGKRTIRSLSTLLLPGILMAVLFIMILGYALLSAARAAAPVGSINIFSMKTHDLSSVFPADATSSHIPSPTPVPTPYYEVHPYRYYQLSGILDYGYFVSEYNYNIEWRILQDSYASCDFTMDYQPLKKSQAAATGYIRHPIAAGSVIGISYHVNEGYIEKIEYTAVFNADDDDYYGYTYPLYSIVNILSNEHFLDYEAAIQSLDVLNVLWEGGSREFISEKADILLQYSEETGLYLTISLVKE